MESDARVAEMFARLGLDVRSDPIPPGEDGARELLDLYDDPTTKYLICPGWEEFGMGAPFMISSVGFEGAFEGSGFRRRDDRFPFVFSRRLEFMIGGGSESSESLYQELRDVVEDMADASVEGFYVRVVLCSRHSRESHAVGVEFVREPAPGAARILLYDSVAYKNWPVDEWSRPLIRGPLGAVARCPRCARAMLWDPGERSQVRVFAPPFASQSGDDEFCQSWPYVLYELRVEVGSFEAALALASASGPAAMRRRLVDFVRRAVRSEFASAFWGERTLRRRDGGEASGADFLRWLRWAAELPGFGEGYVVEASIFERTDA
jgi:hypothetical protein